MSCVQLEGINGLPKLQITAAKSVVEVYFHGATLTKYVANGKEIIYVSENAIFDGVKAIRGGVPLVFPQFSRPLASMPQHGFLRTASTWKLSSTTVLAPDEITVALTTSANEETLKYWPYQFNATFIITLSSTHLKYSLQIQNTDNNAFLCHTLLHTYIKVPSIHDITIKGFQNLSYIDKLSTSSLPVQETHAAVAFTSEVDRIYIDTPAQSIPDLDVAVEGKPYVRVSKRALRVTVDAFEDLPCDVVLWNPWVKKAGELADLGADNFPKFVCIEPGTVINWIPLEPQQILVLEQVLVPL